MAYEKHTWQTGEVITAEKLNKLEGAVGDFVINFTTTYDENKDDIIATCDKTYNEINEAYSSGRHITAFISGVRWSAENEIVELLTTSCFLDYVETYESKISYTFSSKLDIGYEAGDEVKLYRVTVTLESKSDPILYYDSELRLQLYAPQ